MDAQLWFFVSVLVFVIIIWFHSLATSGYIQTLTEQDFVIRTFLGRRVRIAWTEVRQPVQRFESFLPRLVLKLGEDKRFTTKSSYAVLLRGRAGERELIERLMASPGIRTIRKLNDLSKRRS